MANLHSFTFYGTNIKLYMGKEGPVFKINNKSRDLIDFIHTLSREDLIDFIDNLTVYYEEI